ncbi:hypothetical protein EW026_g7161 [Hermanssonia centrifuga]|uniref:Uncharacterized protein n=1 Tax=Hermanssonia centrifuga TaxID=98765 RepID=A0A4S4K8P9_9APHY|nr:hypothetical protein EW026_g7161 [Hermanssonia centrifuga]
MHNILLGVTKTQWFEIWIKGNALQESTEKTPRELDAIHTYLKAFEMPSWVARLPNKVGYPAGGSLTSDKWKAMLLLYCPLIIPIIWKEWGPAAEREYQVKLDKWQKKKGNKPAEPKQQMQLEDTDNFLNLATAMKILLVQSISINDIPLAKLQLQNYLIPRMILKTDMNERGTVAALGQEIAEAAQEFSTNFALGTGCRTTLSLNN